MKALAKNDVKVLMEDGRFSDFRKGNEYKFVFRNDDQVVLMDENRTGYICDRKEFKEDFEICEM